MAQTKIDVRRMSREMRIDIVQVCTILGIPFKAETAEELRKIGPYDPEEIPVAEIRRRRKLQREQAAMRLRQNLRTEDLVVALMQAPSPSPEQKLLYKRYFNRIKKSLRGITVTALVVNIYEAVPEKYRAIRHYVMKRLLSLYKPTAESLSNLVAERGRFHSDDLAYKLLTKCLTKLSHTALSSAAKSMEDLQSIRPCLSKGATKICNSRINRMIMCDLRNAKTPDAVKQIYLTRLKHFPIKAHREVVIKWHRLSRHAIRKAKTVEEINAALAAANPNDFDLKELAVKKAAPFFQSEE